MRLTPFLTPVQIAVLALAHETHARDRNAPFAVYGSWQTAAEALIKLFALIPLGTADASGGAEWRNLRGTSRGPKGRKVHLYRLASGHDSVAALAARCAWATAHKPAGRTMVTWKDVPTAVPRTPWAPHGRRCPACGCLPGKPCVIVLANGCGEGECVPAGMYGFQRCTGCQEAA